MKIAVLGTGMVGRALAGRLAGLEHDVVVGTRDVEQTLARTEPGSMGTPPYAEWQQATPAVRLLPFHEAGAHGELILNATAGAQAMAALEATGAQNLTGKVLLDLAIPLDFSHGMPPQLLVANTDSLGEQIQRAFPDTRAVKTQGAARRALQISNGGLCPQLRPRPASRGKRAEPLDTPGPELARSQQAVSRRRAARRACGPR